MLRRQKTKSEERLSFSVLEKSAVELVADLRERRITALELLEITIKRAEQADEKFNPIALKLYDRARQKAQEADLLLAQGLGGALCGLPITIKDSQWLAGVPCANGSHSLANFIPDETCAAIKCLEQADAVIFAKTTCPEFSLSGCTTSSLYGTTSNPWNENRTCGGSSGGAGAAIASGVGSLSLGGDGGGSIRIPAAFCGIVGFKPSFAAVPREPSFSPWKSLMSDGPMARSVADARLMFSVLVGDTADYHYRSNLEAHAASPLQIKGQRLIVSEDMGSVPIDDDVRASFHQTLQLLTDAGAELVYDHPNLPSSVVAWATIAHFDSWNFQKEKVKPLDGIEKRTVGMMHFGASLTHEEFVAAENYRSQIYDAYMAMFSRAGSSIFITPAIGCEAFDKKNRAPKKIGSTRISMPWLDWLGFSYDANLTGMPACALPMGLGNENLPLSIQVTGPKETDAAVLDIAEQLETLIGWDNRPKGFV